MKKIFTIIAASLMISGFANAQDPATPNAGFEDWTQVGNHFDPTNWNSLNPTTSILGVFTCTRASGVDKHSGNYAIKLTTKSIFGIQANGIASTGNLITTAPYGVTGGLPFTLRPDSIIGWFKYIPASGDSGFIQFQLKHNGDTVGYVRFQTGTATTNTYTRFSAAIQYYSSVAPDTALWLLSSSRASNPVVTSAIYLDDLQLIYNPAPVCNTPTSLNTTNIKATSAKLNWAAVAGAVQYRLRYRVSGTTTWIPSSTTNLYKTIGSLTASTNYQWQIRTKCSNSPILYSPWSTSQNFTTIPLRESDVLSSNLNLLSVYPNPASDKINLSFDYGNNSESNHGDAALSIANTLGQIVLNKTVKVIDGIYKDVIDISTFSKGIYSLRVSTATESSVIKLLVQ